MGSSNRGRERPCSSASRTVRTGVLPDRRRRHPHARLVRDRRIAAATGGRGPALFDLMSRAPESPLVLGLRGAVAQRFARERWKVASSSSGSRGDPRRGAESPFHPGEVSLERQGSSRLLPPQHGALPRGDRRRCSTRADPSFISSPARP
jgi:hypothetical protein